MFPKLHPDHIRVVRASTEGQALASYASVFRRLRLQALQDSPESFTEVYDDVAQRPEQFWVRFLREHQGMIHIAFAITKVQAADEHGDDTTWIVENGTPLSMAVNTGPIPAKNFLCPAGSGLQRNRPASEEYCFHGDMLYHIPSVRGKLRGQLFELLVLDRDRWLLEVLRASSVDPPPVARFRANIRPGKNQETLLQFYVKVGWHIAGEQTWAANVLAKGGSGAVVAARDRGDDMNVVCIVLERVFTVRHLEWQIARNSRVVDSARRRNASML